METAEFKAGVEYLETTRTQKKNCLLCVQKLFGGAATVLLFRII